MFLTQILRESSNEFPFPERICEEMLKHVQKKLEPLLYKILLPYQRLHVIFFMPLSHEATLPIFRGINKSTMSNRQPKTPRMLLAFIIIQKLFPMGFPSCDCHDSIGLAWCSIRQNVQLACKVSVSKLDLYPFMFILCNAKNITKINIFSQT